MLLSLYMFGPGPRCTCEFPKIRGKGPLFSETPTYVLVCTQTYCISTTTVRKGFWLRPLEPEHQKLVSSYRFRSLWIRKIILYSAILYTIYDTILYYTGPAESMLRAPSSGSDLDMWCSGTRQVLGLATCCFRAHVAG